MNTSGVTVSPTPGNLLDEFEEAYQNCLAPLIKEDPLTCVDMPELKTNSEANTTYFMEMGRLMQAFFLQKRFQLAAQKPELVILEDVAELRIELARKDELIKKQSEKLSDWQATISILQSHPGSGPTSTDPSTSSTTATPSNSSVTTTPTATLPGATTAAPNTMAQRSAMMSQQASMSMGHSPGQSQSPMGHMMSPGMSPNQQIAMEGGRGGVGMHMGGGNSPHMGSMPGSAILNAQQGGGDGGGGYGGSGGGGSSSLLMGGYGGGASFPGGVNRPIPGGGLQGPLAFLEKTTTNIGMP